jgi:hypothetical protein
VTIWTALGGLRDGVATSVLASSCNCGIGSAALVEILKFVRPEKAFGLRSMCGSDLVGNPMKNAVTGHLPDEHFVIRVDGRVKSQHRRFLDALREGLQLRDQFPQHDVKVESTQANDQQRAVLH